MKLVLLIATILLSGCATIDQYKQRDLLLGPKHVNVHDATSFTAAKRNARTNYSGETVKDATPKEIKRYLDEGLAAANINCRDYFNRVVSASRKSTLARSEFNIIAALTTAISAVFGANADFLAMLGLGVTSVNQYADAYADVVFEAPETSGIRSKVLELMDGYAKELLRDAERLSYPQANVRLYAYEDICSPGSVRELVNTSIRQSSATITPAGSVVVK